MKHVNYWIKHINTYLPKALTKDPCKITKAIKIMLVIFSTIIEKAVTSIYSA